VQKRKRTCYASVAANFCRQQHDAVEIMEAVVALKKSGRTNREIAGIFGKSEVWVYQYSSLERLALAKRLEGLCESLLILGDALRR